MDTPARRGGGGTHSSSLTLPAGVLERLPFLQEERCVFFDFGVMLFAPPSHNHQSRALPISQMTTEPIVTVITEKHLVVATFPRATRPPRVIPHEHVCGVSKEGDDRIAIHLAGDGGDLRVVLGKSDTFVVFLVDLQDRAMGRSMHFAQQQEKQPQQQQQRPIQPAHGGEHGSRMGLTASALHAAEAVLENTEVDLGAIRFGRASQRTARPPAELDEGSDASSIGTIDHILDEACEVPVAVDFPLVTVDCTSLHRRLFYFFQQYDRSKLPFIEQMIAHHRGAETQLLRELQEQYGPEPNKARWECRDQIAHQRALKDQLTAQLKRAKDELILLAKEGVFLEASQKRVDDLTEDFVQRLRNRYLRFSATAGDLQARSSALTSSGDVELLCVTRLLPLLNRSPSESGFDDASTTSSSGTAFPEGTVEVVAYWIAPSVFYAFVKEQAERVQGAALPPICIVERKPSHTQSGIASPGQSSFWCNWSFLAGWALEFGAHSVAVMQKKSPNDPPSVRYVSSKHFWKEGV